MDNIYMSYPFGVNKSLKKIFGGLLCGAVTEDNEFRSEIITVSRMNMNRFLSQFSVNVFQDNYAIFYSIFEARIHEFDTDQLEAYIDNNKDLILNSPFVDLTPYKTKNEGVTLSDDEIIVYITQALKDLLVELSNMYVDETSFVSACELFLDFYIKQAYMIMAQNMTRIVSDVGLVVKLRNKSKRLYRGMDDSEEYHTAMMAQIEELKTMGKTHDILLDADWVLDEEQKDNEDTDLYEALLYSGLTEIDIVTDGFRRSHVIGVLGPPKGGKTRFTTHLITKALLEGKHVAIWSLEGSKEEWQAMIIANIIKVQYNVDLSSKYILNRKYKTDLEHRKMVSAAKILLASSEQAGKVSFIEKACYVETFIAQLENHYKNVNPFDIIVIDQLINVQSQRGTGKVDRISEAYQKLKTHLQVGMEIPAMAIIPCQLKQSVVDMLRKNPDETIDVTAGGESAETIRSPDEVIGLFSNKLERDQGMMKFYSVASRHGGTFDDFTARTSLGCCWFESDPTLNG